VHALPLSASVPLWTQLVGAACLPAVPFFFIASGYFLRLHDGFSAAILLGPLRRLLPIYLFWLLAYVLFLKVVPLHTWSFHLRDWLWGGPAYHLWFVPALAFALAFVGTGLSLVGPELTGLACMVLAGIALAGGAYHDLLHMPGSPILHVGQLAGPMYVYIGAMLARWRITIQWRWLAVMIVLAYGLVVGEEMLLARTPGEPPHDVVLSAFIMGTIVFLAARAIPEPRALRGITRLGRVTLGVYAVHLCILWLLLPYIGNDSPWLVAVLACFVFVLATIVSLGMQSVPGLRSFVR
jgi:surface polysaccharide O-acyltransferase-like enzyme